MSICVYMQYMVYNCVYLVHLFTSGKLTTSCVNPCVGEAAEAEAERVGVLSRRLEAHTHTAHTAIVRVRRARRSFMLNVELNLEGI
jgi:hypothetical protein